MLLVVTILFGFCHFFNMALKIAESIFGDFLTHQAITLLVINKSSIILFSELLFRGDDRRVQHPHRHPHRLHILHILLLLCQIPQHPPLFVQVSRTSLQSWIISLPGNDVTFRKTVWPTWTNGDCSRNQNRYAQLWPKHLRKRRRREHNQKIDIFFSSGSLSLPLPCLDLCVEVCQTLRPNDHSPIVYLSERFSENEVWCDLLLFL